LLKMLKIKKPRRANTSQTAVDFNNEEFKELLLGENRYIAEDDCSSTGIDVQRRTALVTPLTSMLTESLPNRIAPTAKTTLRLVFI